MDELTKATNRMHNYGIAGLIVAGVLCMMALVKSDTTFMIFGCTMIIFTQLNRIATALERRF